MDDHRPPPPHSSHKLMAQQRRHMGFPVLLCLGLILIVNFAQGFQQPSFTGQAVKVLASDLKNRAPRGGVVRDVSKESGVERGGLELCLCPFCFWTYRGGNSLVQVGNEDVLKARRALRGGSLTVASKALAMSKKDEDFPVNNNEAFAPIKIEGFKGNDVKMGDRYVGSCNQDEDKERMKSKQQAPHDDMLSMQDFLIDLIRGYKKYLSPLLPPACRFLPTCSVYAVESIQTYGAAKGVVLTAWRLMRCTPIGGYGYDPPQWPPPAFNAGTGGKSRGKKTSKGVSSQSGKNKNRK